MAIVLEKECNYAGLDIKKVEKIAKGLDIYAKMAKRLGLIIFGGAGTGTLRWEKDSEEHGGKDLVVAILDTCIFDGGDGSYNDMTDDGLTRGEGTS